MKMITKFVLESIVANRIWLSDQDRSFQRQLCTALDGAPEGVDHIFAMEH